VQKKFAREKREATIKEIKKYSIGSSSGVEAGKGNCREKKVLNPTHHKDSNLAFDFCNPSLTIYCSSRRMKFHPRPALKANGTLKRSLSHVAICR